MWMIILKAKRGRRRVLDDWPAFPPITEDELLILEAFLPEALTVIMSDEMPAQQTGAAEPKDLCDSADSSPQMPSFKRAV